MFTSGQAEQFKRLCGIFCTRIECATVLDMDPSELDESIAEAFPDTPTFDEAAEIFGGVGRANIRRKQFELAMDGDKRMLIFLGKNYLGQADDGVRDDKPRRTASTGNTFEVVMQRRNERKKAAEA